MLQAIVNGRVLLPDHAVENACLLFGEKIEALVTPGGVPADAARIDAGGAYSGRGGAADTVRPVGG